jgi:multicomponent K+:H+ antiporter subunit F
MIFHAALLALLLIAAALLLSLYRLVRGPTTLDRVLALDTMTVSVIAVIVTGGVLVGSKIYFEAAILIAMVGFVTTVAFAKYLLRGDVIE